MKTLILIASLWAFTAKGQAISERDSAAWSHVYQSGVYLNKAVNSTIAGSALVIVGTLIYSKTDLAAGTDYRPLAGFMIAAGGIFEIRSLVMLYKSSNELQLAASARGLSVTIKF